MDRASYGATLAGYEDEKKQFLAYVKNVLGIGYYARWGAEKSLANADDLKNAERKFREAIALDPHYSPAGSNLAVLLLDRIEQSMKTSDRAGKTKLEASFAEPESLLRNALRIPQPPRTTSKIYNNLAYSALQRAFLRAESQDFNAALKNVDVALDWVERGLAKESPAPVLAATKAETTAYKAYLRSVTGAGDADGLAVEALKLLNEAKARSYDFQVKDSAELFDGSPALAKFVERFGSRKSEVLAAVGLRS